MKAKTFFLVLAAIVLSIVLFQIVFHHDDYFGPPKTKHVSADSAFIDGSSLTEPAVKMLYTDFDRICGQVSDAKDDTSEHVSANTKTHIYRLAYNEERSKNKCWGTFTFTDGVLTSITRH